MTSPHAHRPPPAAYDPARVAAYFDAFAEAEWERLVRRPSHRVSLAVHTHYLRRCVERGSRVLEVGAGPGRFTLELARLGCRVTVTDISPVQLRLNREKAVEHGFDDAVDERLLLDVTDMGVLESRSFDAVVCYGGPLGYAMDRRDEGLGECVRVTREGGVVLVSVASLWGSAHAGLPFVMGVPADANQRILRTGDLTGDVLPGHAHECHVFRGDEFERFLGRGGLVVEVVSASSCLATGWDEDLVAIESDEARWSELVAMEIEACAQRGCRDMGRHLIGVGRVTEATGTPA